MTTSRPGSTWRTSHPPVAPVAPRSQRSPDHSNGPVTITTARVMGTSHPAPTPLNATRPPGATSSSV